MVQDETGGGVDLIPVDGQLLRDVAPSSGYCLANGLRLCVERLAELFDFTRIDFKRLTDLPHDLESRSCLPGLDKVNSAWCYVRFPG
jgi:hypothetical protein